jgi:GTP-binding protein EngB required for normal cell division
MPNKNRIIKVNFFNSDDHNEKTLIFVGDETVGKSSIIKLLK